MFPKVLVDPAPIFLQDGNVYTSAGVTAGLDLALALVEQDQGPAVALKSHATW
jgi:transcriptional regulator GlxA family with amidase domain